MQLQEMLAMDVVVRGEVGEEGVHGVVDLRHGLDAEDGGVGGERLEGRVAFVDEG